MDDEVILNYQMFFGSEDSINSLSDSDDEIEMEFDDKNK